MTTLNVKPRRLWVHDECAPDAETVHEAYARLVGEPWDKADAIKYIDGGDADVYIMRNGYTVTSSFPGASTIYAPPRDGIGIIADERHRQVGAEGWTPEHDAKHIGEELALAAACYALPQPIRTLRVMFQDLRSALWPFSERWWKPSTHDRIGELAKAGALIAAEIDRLQAKEVAS